MTNALSRMKVSVDFRINPPLTKLKVFRLHSILTKQSNMTEHYFPLIGFKKKMEPAHAPCLGHPLPCIPNSQYIKHNANT
jgi:hypothetical protein